MTVLLILAVAGIAQTMATPSSKYTAIGGCEVDKVCLFSYTAEQQFGENRMSLAANVETVCHSVGMFNGSSATQYCMAISDSQLNGNFLNTRSDITKKNFEKHIDQTLSGWFCFVQTEDGKIATVQHSINESEIAVNIKKSIAAAFQANFKGTTEEVERDLQSDHVAHYRFEPDENGNQKMHRHIENDDVISYAPGAKTNRFRLVKDEDIDYKQGTLQHSSGSILVVLQNSQNQDQKEMTMSKALSSRGSYTMDLQHCYTPAKQKKRQQKQSLSEEMSTDVKEEDLKASFDTAKIDQEKLAYIRENKLQSVAKALRKLHQNQHNSMLLKQLKSILVLEYQHGSIEGYSPALTDVINYFQTIKVSEDSSDMQMRRIIYNLLSAEGSLKSQMVLFESLQSVTNHKEREAIIKEISMVDNAHMEFINALKRYLTSGVKSEDMDLLLISFGTLASRAQVEVRVAITRFLRQMEATVDDGNTSRLIHLLLAMGNTGSDNVIDVILQYINDPQQRLQTAAISALIKFTSNEYILNQLTEMLKSNPPRETLVAILQTLIKGQEYAVRMDIDMSMASKHPILSTLVSAVLKTNDTALLNHVALYIKKVGGEQSFVLLDQLYPRVQRGAAWDDTSNPSYDCIAIPYSRSYDVSAFPKHSAYLHHKVVGNSDVNLTVTAGVFIGMSSDCRDMMSFARVCVDAGIFSESRYIADTEAWVEKSQSTIEGNTWLSVAEGTPEVYEHTTQSCFSRDDVINQQPEHLYDITLNLFLYVGYVSYTIRVELGYKVSFDDQLCPDLVETPNELISSITGVVMNVSISLDGSGTYTFFDFFRASLTVDADLSYQVEPRGSSVVCAESCSTGQFQSCAAMYEEWPANSIRLTASTQMKQLEWCYRRYAWFSVPYPCFQWGRWTPYAPMTYTWSTNAETNTVSTTCNPSTSACATTVAPL